mmetsp:Transcript_29231/g.73388  ORF Transcript_29231/g.73388 Transcript_29231/m.73388 type:complete len:148 (+) Transcript_29231:1319-1762(+)
MITPYAVERVKAQAVLSLTYQVYLTVKCGDVCDWRYIVIYPGHAQAPVNRSEMAAEYGRAFTEIVSDVEESNIDLLRQGHAAGLAAARAIAKLRSAGGGSSSAAGSESAGSEQRQRAADYGLGADRGSGWRVTSLKRCSCQGRKHSG